MTHQTDHPTSQRPEPARGEWLPGPAERLAGEEEGLPKESLERGQPAHRAAGREQE